MCSIPAVERTAAVLLVVDDEPSLRTLFAAAFRKRGYEVIEADTGTACLEAVAHHHVDLVLLDSGLPDVPGPDVVRTLRSDRRHATLPIIMVTGRAEVSERVEALRGGANDYVVKPVVFEELLARVEATLREQRSWQARLSERISVHGRLLADLADVADHGDGLVALARVVHDSLGFRRLVVAELLVTDSILVRVRASARGAARPDGEAVDDLHGLSDEIRRVVGAGASLLHAGRARSVFGPTAGPSLLLAVRGSGESVIALIGEFEPAADPDGAVLRDAVAGLTDLASVIEATVVGLRTSVNATARREIEAIIETQALRPVFQPICELTSREVIGYEALTRFDDGEPPNLRFSQAHEFGLGADLELEALRLALSHASSLPPDAMVSVNLSPSLIGRPELRAAVGSCVRPICLELTENERIGDYEQLLAAFAELPDHVRLSVDDAGSGWASLWHVHSIRPAYVKLDRAWVDGIHADPARQILMRGLHLFVTEVGGQLIAEGIEDPADVAPLQAVGVTLGQGFLFGRPAPVETWFGNDGPTPHRPGR